MYETNSSSNFLSTHTGREESRDIKHITRLERRRQRKNHRRKQAELVDTPITVAEGPDKEVSFSVTNKTENASSRSMCSNVCL